MGLERKGTAVCVYGRRLYRRYSMVLLAWLFRLQVRVGGHKALRNDSNFGKMGRTRSRPDGSSWKMGRGRVWTRVRAFRTLVPAPQTFALALSFTWPSCISTEYSTASQLCCLRISLVFFLTNAAKESRSPETFSPDFFLASTRILYRN